MTKPTAASVALSGSTNDPAIRPPPIRVMGIHSAQCRFSLCSHLLAMDIRLLHPGRTQRAGRLPVSLTSRLLDSYSPSARRLVPSLSARGVVRPCAIPAEGGNRRAHPMPTASVMTRLDSTPRVRRRPPARRSGNFLAGPPCRYRPKSRRSTSPLPSSGLSGRTTEVVHSPRGLSP